MKRWGDWKRGRWSGAWSTDDIPRPEVGWYWRGGDDDPVGTLAVALAGRGADPIVMLAVEFSAPRWAHGLLGIIAR